MNEQKLQALFAAHTQELPEAFHRAMTQTLDGIVAQERMEQARGERPARALRLTRRTLVLAALIALLVATAAVAAYHWQVFDLIWPFFSSGAPKNAGQVMKSNLHQETVNNVEITVKEGGYDGRTLYLLYSYRMLDVDVPLGELGGEGGIDTVPEEAFERLDAHGVGWWIDHLWFNGSAIDMPNNSTTSYNATSAPGEMEVYESWRLDNVGLFLNGEVEISLPIGRKQALQDFSFQNHPEKYDENGALKLPEDGVVTFTMNVDAIQGQVITEHPNVETVTPEVTAKVTEVAFSPLLTYITLGLEVNPDAMAAFIAENGEGYCDEEGRLLFPYDGGHVFGDYLLSLSLVDGQGRELFPGVYGDNGYGNKWAEFIYPYIEDMPAELWLAPVTDGQADMTYAIRVR